MRHYCSAPQWRNRQTRHVQGVVGISSWGFKSLLRHLKEGDFDSEASFFCTQHSAISNQVAVSNLICTSTALWIAK